MNEISVTQFILENLPGVETSEAFGYTFFFFGSNRKMPFATLGDSDNDYDKASNLNRDGVFRLNIGVSRETYQSLLGPLPAAPGESGIIATGHDFSVLDQLLPHPVYAPQAWVCVLSPSATTFANQIQPLLTEAHGIARQRQLRKEANQSSED